MARPPPRVPATLERKPGHARRAGPAARPAEPAPAARVAAATSPASAPARTPTAGAGSSTRRCASAASGRGGRSGRCCGCRASACRSSACSASRSRRWAGAPDPRTCSRSCRREHGSWRSPDTGHFVHIEQPDLVGRPRSSTVGAPMTADRSRGSTTTRCALALHHAAPAADGRTARPCSCSTGWASGRPSRCRPGRPWPGPVLGPRLHRPRPLDRAAGGGYSAEVLMGDVDVALADLGPSHRASGAGSAPTSPCSSPAPGPTLVRGAVLCDGPGLVGGGIGPTVGRADDRRPRRRARPARPVGPARAGSRRPAARLRRRASPARPRSSPASAWPVAVCARWRPPWLEAVAGEPGVLDVTVDEALAFFAA